jgi:hypothetical protein
MDDFIYGEPQPVPAAEPDTKGPQLTVDGVAKNLRPGKFAKGLRLELATDEAARIDARLVATTRSVELAPGEIRRVKANVLLDEKAVRVDAAERRLKLKPKRSVVRGANRLKAELRIAATDADGNRTVLRRKIKVG